MARKSGTRKHLKVETLESRQLLAVGVTIDTPEAADGYTLFSPSINDTTYLIDHRGREINSWQSPSGLGPMSAYLMPDGSLLRTGREANTGSSINAPGAGGLVELMDWDGSLLWQFRLNETDGQGPGSDGLADRRLHHDIEPILDENGNLSSILMIAWERLSPAQASALGRSNVPAGGLWPDMVIEVKYDPTESVADVGDIIWEWRLSDHVTTQPAANPQLVNINYAPSGTGAGSPTNDWTHFNSIDYNPALDQIVVSSREFSEFWIIDHSTTTQEAAGHTGGNSGKGGDLLYRWGNPQTYGAGTRADQQLFYQHDARWIEEGKPGAGNITAFNNGWNRQDGSSYSSVVEVATMSGGQFALTDTNATGAPDVFVNAMSNVPTSWQTISGDWWGTDSDSVGFYDPAKREFHLHNAQSKSTLSVAVGAAGTNWIALAGDWNGDGTDELGLYDAVQHTFHFYDHTGSEFLPKFQTPSLPSNWIPLAGDWDGDGDDTVGLYDPSYHTFYLNDEINGSVNRVTRFRTPALPSNWVPVSGDWDGDGDDTVGVFDPAADRFYLNNDINGSISRVNQFVLNGKPSRSQLMIGDWDGDGISTVGYYDANHAGNGYSFGNDAPVWSYTSTPRSTFFATIISNANRLENGNTLINEGTEGRFFEVTPDGEIVWQYTNPITAQGALSSGQSPGPLEIGIPGVRANMTFRAERYAADYLDPSIDVTPGAKLELNAIPEPTDPDPTDPDPTDPDPTDPTDPDPTDPTDPDPTDPTDPDPTDPTDPDPTDPDPTDPDPTTDLKLVADGIDTAGFYNAAAGAWHLNNATTGANNDVVAVQWNPASGSPVMGDFDGDGTDSPAIYNGPSRTFYFTNDGGLTTQSFVIPGAGANWLPLAGDWNNDGADQVGLYDQSAHTFHFYNLDGTVAVAAFTTPALPSTWLPLAGDWNGDGFDTVGLYDSLYYTFYLNDAIDGSINKVTRFQTPRLPSNWLPLSGDWDGDGDDTVGVYDPSNRRFYLNDNIDGSLNRVKTFVIADSGARGVPVAGDWGSETASSLKLQQPASGWVAADDPATLSPTLANSVFQSAVDEVMASLGVDLSSRLEVSVVDLPGSQLGLFDGNDRILLDVNAASFGWYVDGLDSPRGGVDLKTVVLHEIGHALGRKHDSEGLLSDSLLPGITYGIDDLL